MSNSAQTPRRDIRVFISAVTRELGSIRQIVKRALLDIDYHPVEQENFPPDYRDVVDKLRVLIERCDAVVHIAGKCYGAEPANRPDDAPRRSFTQLEYDIAVGLKRPVYVFLTGEDFAADAHDPEPDDLQELQAAHCRSLMSTGRDYTRTASIHELNQKIRSLQLRVERLTDELQQVDQKLDVHGGRLRRWLVAGAVLAIAVLGAVVYFGWRQQVEHRAQARERLAAEAARKEAQTTQQVQQEFAERFLTQLLSDSKITAEDARKRALSELPALVNLPLKKIESLIDGMIPPESPLDRARSALAKGNYDEVREIADRLKPQARELAMLEGTAALASFRQSPSSEWNARALAAFQQAMALAEPNSEWQAWTDAAISAASVLYDLGRYAEAEPLLRDCLQRLEANDRPDSQGVATVLDDLARLLQATNRLSEAEAVFRRAVAIAEHEYGPAHHALAMALNNLAGLLEATNRMHEAQLLFRRALAIAEGSRGQDHPDVAYDLNNLARTLSAANRLVEAEPLLRRALEIDEHSYGPIHFLVAIRIGNLAGLLQATGRLGEAEPLAARVVRIISEIQRSTGHEHPQLRDATERYRQLLSLLKLPEPAIEARTKTAVATDRLSPIVPEVKRPVGPSRAVNEVLTTLDRQFIKEQGETATYFLAPKEPIAPHLDALLRLNGDGLCAQGVAAFRRGSHADAVVLYEAALELMADQPAWLPAKLRTRMDRAAAWRELGFVAQARDELSKLLPELDRLPDSESLMKCRARYDLAFCQWRLGDRVASQRLAEESLGAYDAAPKANPMNPEVRRQSEELLENVKKGKPPPPIGAKDAPALLESARARHRAIEALTKLPLNEKAASLLDQVLGPAGSTEDVFKALDRKYREQDRPPVWFLPSKEPIAPRLDGLPGEPSR